MVCARDSGLVTHDQPTTHDSRPTTTLPELPEVETMVRGVRPALLGQKILKATLSHTDVLRGVTRPRLLRALNGAQITDVFRRAKHAVVELGELRLVLQPGMTGNLLIYDRKLTAAEAKYAVLRVTLKSGAEFIFRDVRRIGTLLLLNRKAWVAYDRALGPEPLDPTLTAEAFRERLCHSRQAIKKSLMDQRRIVGVGNIYANEALFAAGIDPSKPSNRVDAEAYQRLYRETRRILQSAIDAEGTTFRDYRTGTGEPGNFQLELQVYEREGERCGQCGTRLTGTHDIDARITVFCWRCQA
jgi:formamidopyrimidine-DNA glycosylase